MSQAQKIKHLFWRAGFGLTPEEWNIKKHWSIQQAVDHLFEGTANPPALQEVDYGISDPQVFKNLKKEDRKAFNKEKALLLVELRKKWQDQMGSSDFNPLVEKMTLFWHNHFASFSNRVDYTMIQHNTLRKNALGSFRDLVLLVAKDPVMLTFLNNQQNRKRSPNENFARELCELFTLGRGNYTEQDIKEAARAFTGWRTEWDGSYNFMEAWHDYGEKEFLGHKGNLFGEDIINIILLQKQTARFITTKLYKYFVSHKLVSGRIEQLSTLFYESGYDIAGLMRHIFSSDWFYEPEIIAERIKSPVELIAGMIRQNGLEIVFARQITFLQQAMGQLLFRPPNVAGWPDGRGWIDNQTLLLRMNIPSGLAGNGVLDVSEQNSLKAKSSERTMRKIVAKKDYTDLINLCKNIPPGEVFAYLADYILQTTPGLTEAEISRGLSTNNLDDYVPKLVLRLQSLPEYQVC